MQSPIKAVKWVHLVFTTAFAAVFVLVGCATSSASVTPTAPASAPEASPTSANEIVLSNLVKHLDRYENQRVTVAGNWTDAVTPRSFTLNNRLAYDPAPVLIITRSDEVLPPGFQPSLGQKIAVTGVVRRFQLAAIEKEVGFNLDSAKFGQFVDSPVIIAETVVALPDSAETNVQDIRLSQLFAETPAYTGEQVRVRGSVGVSLNPRLFVIADPAMPQQQLLVVLPYETTTLGVGEQIAVTGTVRAFDREVIQVATGLDMQNVDLSAYTNQPMLLATAVARTNATALPAATSTPQQAN